MRRNVLEEIRRADFEKEKAQRLRMENIELHLQLGHTIISLTKVETDKLANHLANMANASGTDGDFANETFFNTILAKLEAK